jgi:uncharacterized protein
MRSSNRNATRGEPTLAAALAVAMALLWPCAARPDVPLYEASVPLKGTTEADRAAGMAEALRAVAVKASGQREAADNPVIAAANPSKFVQRYSTTADRMLKVGFDARSTEQLLQQAGLPLWPAERPLTLVNAPVGDPLELEAAAQWRGLPISWSSGAPAPQEGASAVLSGVPSGAGFAWTFSHDGRTVQGRGSPADGVNLAADALAARYAPPSTRSSSSLTLRIGGMDDLRSYSGLLAYLRSLSLVRDVDVLSLEATVLTVQVVVRGDRELLARVAVLDDHLRPVAPGEANAGPAADFMYRP